MFHVHSVEITEIHSRQLSRYFGKKFVKTTHLLNKSLKNWFDGKKFRWEYIFHFSTLCVVHCNFSKNVEKTTYLKIIKSVFSRNSFQIRENDSFVWLVWFNFLHFSWNCFQQSKRIQIADFREINCKKRRTLNNRIYLVKRIQRHSCFSTHCSSNGYKNYT